VKAIGAPGGRLARSSLAATSVLVYVFLYLPIALLVLFSFNDARTGTAWAGFTTGWYAARLREGGTGMITSSDGFQSLTNVPPSRQWGSSLSSTPGPTRPPRRRRSSSSSTEWRN